MNDLILSKISIESLIEKIDSLIYLSEINSFNSNNSNKLSIYSNSQFSSYLKKIELLMDKIVKNQNEIILNKAIELIDSKRINLQNLESNYQESREVNLIKENKNNPHSFLKNQNELNKYNEGLRDAAAVLNGLLKTEQ